MIATTTATVLRATNTLDSQPVWALLPAALLLSGGLGVFYAQRCQDREDALAPVPQSADPMPDAAADVGADSLGDAALPDATDGSTTMLIDAPGVRDPHATAPDAQPGVTPLPCSISPTVLCPDHFSCALVDGNSGTCTPDQ